MSRWALGLADALSPRNALVVASLLLSAAIGWVFSRGGARQESRRERPLIGFSMDTLKEEHWPIDKELFSRKVRELGADVLVQAANSDDTRQIQDIEALISRKVDVLVIVPHNAAAMAKGVRLAHAAGIPVIAYDRLITGVDLDLYVTFDSVKVGREQARYLVESFQGKGKKKLVRVLGAKTDNNVIMVKRGQDSVLAPAIERGEIEIVHEDWAEDWKPENAKKIVQAAVTRLGPNFDAVLAANDGTAGGAVQALLEDGLAGKVLVTGQDAELAACQRIVGGTQSMTVYKPIKALADLAAEMAVRMARGRPIVVKEEIDNGFAKIPAVFVPVHAVTKQNMLETVVRDGYHARSDVYRAR